MPCDHRSAGGSIDRRPAARAGRRVAGPAEGLATGRARTLAGRLGQVQLVVAHEADAVEAKTRLAQRRRGCFDQRMPVEPDGPFALAAPDQHVEALHRHIEIERLNPFDAYTE